MNLVRRLQLKQGTGTRNVDLTFFLPVERDDSWVCRYEIGWPGGAAGDDIWGFDATQALYLSMQAAALAIYASADHKAGRLYWQKPGAGYGLPMPKAGRGDLVGEDRVSQV